MAGRTGTGQAMMAWVSGQDTLRQASHRMNELGEAVLPVHGGGHDRTLGLISREMIIACIAAGGDPNALTAADIARRTPLAGRETAPRGGPASATGAGTRYPQVTTAGQVPDHVLLAALRSLPAESQTLIYLADVTGLSYRQIAGVLGLPAEAVAARLHRTRQRLRRGFCT